MNVKDGLNLDEANQYFAVSILGTDGSPKYDARYVRLMAVQHIKNDDGSDTFLDYPLHDCTQEDLAHFYQADEETQAMQKNWENLVQASIEDSLKCLD